MLNFATTNIENLKSHTLILSNGPKWPKEVNQYIRNIIIILAYWHTQHSKDIKQKDVKASIYHALVYL